MHPLLQDALSTIKPGERVLFYININNFDDDDISNDSIYHVNDMYGDCVRIDSDMGSIRDWCDKPSDEFSEFITTTPIRSPFDWSDDDYSTDIQWGECINISRKNSVLKKYGVENISKLESVKVKVKETNLEKYGVDNPMKLIEIKEKVKN